jgi:hypothetical protein
MEMNRDWLARYRVGQREQVWHELRQLGTAFREPEIRAQAQLVCDEMAVRARRNIEALLQPVGTHTFLGREDVARLAAGLRPLSSKDLQYLR